MLIQRATLLDGRVVDVRVDRRIVAVADHLVPTPGEDVLDASHRTLIPGLHDHHVHLHSAAAALTSVAVGPRDVPGPDDLRRVLAAAAPGPDGWIRAVGYHEAVAGPLHRDDVDAVRADVPVRVQHRTGVLWTLNSAGLAAVGLPGHPDGRLRSADRAWTAALARRDVGLAEVSRRLARHGVTGVTDATPDLGVADVVALAEAHRRGELLQRVYCLAPGKRILHDDGLNLDELTAWVAARHAAGGTVAVHCVTAPQLVITLAALRAAGPVPGDRIEHAAVVPDDCLADIADLGVVVATQPNFVAERGDQYLADVPAAELPDLWRLRSLLDAGVAVTLSTDLPFGDPDPWAAMRAAVGRTTPSGAVLGAAETVPARVALRLFHGDAEHPTDPRTVEAGQPADLCLLDGGPDEVLADLSGERVAATLVEGRLAYDRL